MSTGKKTKREIVLELKAQGFSRDELIEQSKSGLLDVTKASIYEVWSDPDGKKLEAKKALARKRHAEDADRRKAKSEAARRNYEAKKESTLARTTDYRLNNPARKFYDEWRKQGCAHCGETNYKVIHAAHKKGHERNGSTKPHRLAASGNLEGIKECLAVCIPLCGNCHTEFDHKPRSLKTYVCKRQLALEEYKEASPCTDCGESFRYYQMQLDHTDPELKSFSIAKAAKTPKAVSDEDFWHEVKVKCELVCNCCHMIRTDSRL